MSSTTIAAAGGSEGEIPRSLTAINIRGSSKPLAQNDQELRLLAEVKAKLDRIAMSPRYKERYEPVQAKGNDEKKAAVPVKYSSLNEWYRA